MQSLLLGSALRVYPRGATYHHSSGYPVRSPRGPGRLHVQRTGIETSLTKFILFMFLYVGEHSAGSTGERNAARHSPRTEGSGPGEFLVLLVPRVLSLGLSEE